MHIARRALGIGLGLSVGVSLACGSPGGAKSSASPGGGSPVARADAGEVDAAVPAFAFSTPCTDSIADVYGDPGVSTGANGDILRCAPGTTLSRSAIAAGFVTGNVVARPPVSGAIEYRILYRTMRATNPPTPGYATASVFLPDTPRALPLPVITIAHGTAGVGAGCASSQTSYLDPTNPHFALAFTLVARGFAVVATDYAGYAAGTMGNSPAGYLFAADEAMSVLDAARALRNLAPRSFGDAVVPVGFSQGGHSVLSALAEDASYGSGGHLAGVVAYSPIWMNMATWGAVFFEAAQFPLSDPGSLSAIKFDVWYHYTHGELLDGPGHGIDVFAESVRPAIQQFIGTICDPGDAPMIASLPGDISTLYDPDFVTAVANSQALGFPCPGDPTQNALCKTWAARYAADRPHITGAATSVPTLIVRGGADTTIPPDRFACGTDRLAADGANVTLCYEPTADHGGTILMRGDYVADWIASETLGEPSPAACAFGAAAMVDEAGAPVACSVPPAND